jgi:hypothetical protein
VALAALGVFVVMHFAVVVKTREIGISDCSRGRLQSCGVEVLPKMCDRRGAGNLQ